MKHTTSLLTKVLTAFFLVFSGISASAQSSFTVKLKLIDEKTSEPVGFATVSVTPKGDTQASRFVMTDADGKAEISKVRKGTYVLKAEMMGYKAYEKETLVEKNLDLGEVKLAEDVTVLDAASVSAVGNPIVVKKDTIEYTASSFKTSDNDMLE